MFNTVTGFREAISFIGFSCESEDVKVHLETFVNEDEDGLVYMKLTTSKGTTALVDTTLKSQCLDSDAYVNLQDFFVICDKGVKDGLVAMWVDDGRLYVGSSYNEGLEAFESEASLPLLEPFELDQNFDADETIQIEQMVASSILDTCYNFDNVEIARTEGILSFRTGDKRVTIATLPATVKTLGVESKEQMRDFAISIPVSIFKLVPLVDTQPLCSMDIDWSLEGRMSLSGIVRCQLRTDEDTAFVRQGHLQCPEDLLEADGAPCAVVGGTGVGDLNHQRPGVPPRSRVGAVQYRCSRPLRVRLSDA